MSIIPVSLAYQNSLPNAFGKESPGVFLEYNSRKNFKSICIMYIHKVSQLITS